eukprot:TRINITY_DN50108_c0_g1_i1.p1 TRINITY_DN50108_c0_g1~~TRINITY_DN50108_c0_g1_i1.p1  ORF type:complete len:706 (-),score=162.40 TRINITY_DN50108_c0_g1_i1:48-2165(-)
MPSTEDSERRVDSFDGKSYTFQEVQEAYAGIYSKKDVRRYWDGLEPTPPAAQVLASAGIKKKSTTGAGGYESITELPVAPIPAELPVTVPKEVVKTKLRGRALLRSSTHGGLDGGDDEHEEDGPAFPVSPLRRVFTACLAGLALGRVASKRSTSDTRKKERKSLLTVPTNQKEVHERGTSVPPASKGEIGAPEAGSWATVAKARSRQRSPRPMAAPPALKRTVSRVVTEEVEGTVDNGSKAIGRDVRRQLRLVVAGLMGSGKSTICRMLAHMLEGRWVNQDEFSHKGKGAKWAFLSEVKETANNKKVPVLIVDKINTMRQHRKDIVDAMSSGGAGDIVFIQLVHPDDRPGNLDNQVQLCLSRIHARGQGHRTLMGNDPKLANILRMTAAGVEPMTSDEASGFSALLTVDMTLSPAVAAMRLLSDLDDEGLLGRFHVEDLVSEHSIAEACQATQQAEQDLVRLKAPVENNKAKPAPLWYWVLEVKKEEKTKIGDAWKAALATGKVPAWLDVQEDFHVTLVYLGGMSDKNIAAKTSHMQESDIKKLRVELHNRDGQEIEVEFTSITCDDRIAAAEVKNVEGICANKHSHITIARKERTPPVLSNELLARRDANADLQTGLSAFFAQLGLQKYEQKAREWCSEESITTADELAARASDFAAVVECTDKDQGARVKTTLLHAVPGDVQEVTLPAPVRVRGIVRSRRRGE